MSMKEKPRPGAEPMDQLYYKKRKTMNNHTDKRDESPCMITSSVRKCRADHKSSKPHALSVPCHLNGQAKDACHDFRLAFIDGAFEISMGAPKELEIIFSPVFDLLKGLEGETSSSCISSVEQADSSDEKLEDAGTVVDCQVNSQISVGSSDQVVDKATALMPMTDSEAILTSRIGHMECVSNSTDDDVFGSQAVFDVGELCVSWSFVDQNRDPSEGIDHVEDGLLDSEGASLFLAVQQSKALDCNYRGSQAQAVADEDLNDFDPYLFIKQLPDLSEVVSPCRSPVLLPKQTRRCPPITLVLDLDETLVHSTLEYCENADFTFPVNFNDQECMVCVRRRPHLQMFLERAAQMFEIIVFTASQSVYAEPLLNVLDPKRKLIWHRMFRDSCVFVDGNYMKDLSVLGRDLAKVAIIDNSPQAFGFQVDNGIPIESWFDDQSDSALVGLLSFLETLVGVDDVRPIIARKFNVRHNIGETTDSRSVANVGDPLDRC